MAIIKLIMQIAAKINRKTKSPIAIVVVVAVTRAFRRFSSSVCVAILISDFIFNVIVNVKIFVLSDWYILKKVTYHSRIHVILINKIESYSLHVVALFFEMLLDHFAQKEFPYVVTLRDDLDWHKGIHRHLL